MNDHGNGFKLHRKIVRTMCASATMFGVAITDSAYAAGPCGDPVGTTPATVTCTTAGNPYPDGIHYFVGVGDLLLNVDSGVVINVTGVGSNTAMDAQASAGTATISAPNVTIVSTNDPGSDNRNGIGAVGNGPGSGVIDAGGTINILGHAHDLAVFAFANGDGNASATWSGTINFTGGSSVGVLTASHGAGNSIADASGDITGTVGVGESFSGGVFAEAYGSGNAEARYHSGTMTMSGKFAYGIAASVQEPSGSGSATVITDPGTKIIINGAPDGEQNGYAAVTVAKYTAGTNTFVLADIASIIESHGGPTPNSTPRFNPIGIRAQAAGGTPVTVLYSGLGITTTGGGGVGIIAASQSGNVIVDSSGPITTDGIIAHGIRADSGGTLPPPVGLVLEFPSDTPIEGPSGLAVVGVGGAVDVTSTRAILTTGLEAYGIFATSSGGPVTVTAGDTRTNGEFGVGILATGGAVTVNVARGGIVRGGWQEDPDDASSRFDLPSAGIIVGTRPVQSPSEVTALVVPTATINIEGTVGALSDRAITEAELFDERFGAENLTINNDGTVVGYLQLGSGEALFNNNSFNSFDMRNFQDTNGNGIRDTEGVAISDFGGGFDEFDNNETGAVRLLSVIGAIHWDTSGQILPDGFLIHSILIPGVEQGQMINLERFENRGLITMQGLETGGLVPIAGDVLVITQSDEAEFSGSGVFVSDGGALHLDTVLNAGGPFSISDILVVDSTETGPRGPTRIAIENAFGLGAITPGDGIKVVDVRDDIRVDQVGIAFSAPDAFVLEGRAAAGPYEYFLFQGGRADPGDGDWYLRTGAFRPEIPAYLGNADAAISMLVHTLHERLGEPQFAEDSPTHGRPLYSAWLRTVGEWSDADAHGFGADTNTWLIQGGLEIADAAMFDGPSRLHGGMMAGYGEGDTDASAIDNPNHAHGETQGTSFGLYATWYANDANRLGLYLDTWAQVGLYDNTVSATAEPDVSYDSDVWLVSLEAGYPFMLGWDRWALEPQGQIVFFDYIQDSVFDHTRTSIDGDQDGWLSRLGARTFGMWADADARKYQPYFEANWWHGFDETSVAFSGIGFTSGVPSDRYEVGLGLNVEITRTVTLWANGEYQWGDNWDGAQALAGVKAAW